MKNIMVNTTCCRIPMTEMYVTRKNLNAHKAGITLDLRVYPHSMRPDEECVEIEIKEK